MKTTSERLLNSQFDSTLNGYHFIRNERTEIAKVWTSFASPFEAAAWILSKLPGATIGEQIDYSAPKGFNLLLTAARKVTK